jgi:hypothetical protein
MQALTISTISANMLRPERRPITTSCTGYGGKPLCRTSPTFCLKFVTHVAKGHALPPGCGCTAVSLD